MNVYERKSIPMYIILSLITCGIFFYYWVYKLSTELYELSGQEGSPAMDIILSIITCGIYFIYLNYKWGKLLSASSKKLTGFENDESFMYLILALFGLSIISISLVQHKLNNEIYPHANANGGSNTSSNQNNNQHQTYDHYQNYDQPQNDAQPQNNVQPQNSDSNDNSNDNLQ